ncbi:protein NRT1/ PTR FAMILY 3.1-like [Argentina anserina]|uniref:protein NRT1/ PTR FAMILY 3.1-like n=1 Tax=Argentina anserina TaxID=57926 RepID=UPI0021766C0D|nr:protein NRT1/ PTR FAMILY 3.1-like [Potentilla anserina]
MQSGTMKTMVEENVENDNILKTSKEKKLGGIKTLPFILANEMCDRFASSGFHSNMITYLTDELNLPLVKASNTLANFSGTASLTPLLGALVADSFAGRFWTITVASIIYELGLIIITISAIFPSFRPPPCPSQVNCKEASGSQLWILYFSLLLTSLGTGGIRPCVVTFAADQLNYKTTGNTKSVINIQKWNFFNWYYFCMTLASLAALTIVVYVQDHVGWGWGLGIPTVAMAVSVVAFVIGSPLYMKLKPGGSPLVRLSQVIVAAFHKRNAQLPHDPKVLYENPKLDDDISVHGKLLNTNQLRWFDRAAIVLATDNVEPKEENEEDGSAHLNLWRLSTVHRVEELKSMVRLLPIGAAAILLVASASHTQSFTIQQARTMDRHISHSFEIEPASLQIFALLTTLLTLPLYERLFVPVTRRFTGNPSGITCLQRMGVGFAINILATFVASFVEIKRKSVATRHNLLDAPRAVIPISVFWLVPQGSLHGLGEVFMHVGHLEFLYDQSPESMRSTAAALYWVAIAIGSYVGTVIVTLVHKFSATSTGNWLPDRNLNRGRLEYYYWLSSGIQVVNLIYFVVCASYYTSKSLEEVSDPREEEVDLAKEKPPSSQMPDA